jgi:hypothetical protein
MNSMGEDGRRRGGKWGIKDEGAIWTVTDNFICPDILFSGWTG